MTTAPAPAPENATTALYRAALGHGNTSRYLAVFAAFDERGMARAHWNTAAGLLSLCWLVYRGLWGRAVLYATAVAALAALAWWMRPMWAVWPDGVAAGLLGLLVLLAVVVPGLGGDGWLHADVRARMTEAVRRARTVDEACQALAKRRRVDRWGLVALVVTGTVALAAALWWSRGADEGLPSAPAAPAVATTDSPPAGTATAQPTESPPAPPTPSADPAPAVSPAATEHTGAPAAPAEPAAAAVLPSGAEPASAPAPAPSPARADAPAAAATQAAEPIRPRLKGLMVNVGLFADAANARRVQASLAAARLPVLVDPVESSRGPLSRIRVGPFADKAQAEAAAAKVRALGLEAQVRAP